MDSKTAVVIGLVSMLLLAAGWAAAGCPRCRKGAPCIVCAKKPWRP